MHAAPPVPHSWTLPWLPLMHLPDTQHPVGHDVPSQAQVPRLSEQYWPMRHGSVPG